MPLDVPFFGHGRILSGILRATVDRGSANDQSGEKWKILRQRAEEEIQLQPICNKEKTGSKKKESLCYSVFGKL